MTTLTSSHINVDIKDFFAKGESHIFVTGDAYEVLKSVPSNTINCVITSPPYWQLRQYDDVDKQKEIGNEPTHIQYVQRLSRVFSEVKRILTDDGSLWLNLGDKYHNKELMGIPWRVALSLMDTGTNFCS